jgi:FMN phosphatase YigB (HAD superfamily)
MDYYLNKENTQKRLFEEYSLVVAFDFDNTVYDFHQNGWRFENMIQLLQDLKSIGCYLIVFTANEDENFVKNYCQKQTIPFDAINENPPFYQSESRKIYYNVLLDDRAGLAQVYEDLKALVLMIKKIKNHEILFRKNNTRIPE